MVACQRESGSRFADGRRRVAAEMSNFIPMLSSSPPPIDEAEPPAAWGDDDDDDFGGFQDAVTEPGGQDFTASPRSSDTPPEPEPHPAAVKTATGLHNSLPCHTDHRLNGNISENTSVCDPVESIPPTQTDAGPDSSCAKGHLRVSSDEGFSDCQSVPESTATNRKLDANENSSNVAGDSGSQSQSAQSSQLNEPQSQVRNCDSNIDSTAGETQTVDNTSQDSVADSGLCSDLSPGASKSEECPQFSSDHRDPSPSQQSGSSHPESPQVGPAESGIETSSSGGEPSEHLPSSESPGRTVLESKDAPCLSTLTEQSESTKCQKSDTKSSESEHESSSKHHKSDVDDNPASDSDGKTGRGELASDKGRSDPDSLNLPGAVCAAEGGGESAESPEDEFGTFGSFRNSSDLHFRASVSEDFDDFHEAEDNGDIAVKDTDDKELEFRVGPDPGW